MDSASSSTDKTRIFIKGQDKTAEILSWSETRENIDVTYKNGRTYSYNKSNVKISSPVLPDKPPASLAETVAARFAYLEKIAEYVGVQDSNGNNILLNRYHEISAADQGNMLYAFLAGKLPQPPSPSSPPQSASAPLYPFGFNNSQKRAVDYALANPLTLIEGPPGTGKTQTILNIIANAVMRGETLAIVSANNSATANILEKLEKYKLGFLAAHLGNAANKAKFREEMNCRTLPDLSSWKIDAHTEAAIRKNINEGFAELQSMLERKNELTAKQAELEALKLEYRYFCLYAAEGKKAEDYLSPMPVAAILKLWFLCERYHSAAQKGFLRKYISARWFRLITHFKYGVCNKAFYRLSAEEQITLCQRFWYETRLLELSNIIAAFQKGFAAFDFSEKMQRCTDLSMRLFRHKIAQKYKNSKRTEKDIKHLWNNSADFLKEFPVILSTVYSLPACFAHKILYNYVVIDECSQVDIATGALALFCAKKLVLVGDQKQLSHIVDSDTARKTDRLFRQSGLPEVYRYKSHNLLNAALTIFPNAPHILLREHYRCHPKIIEFCNRKFYNGELIILTKASNRRTPLILYKTVAGNHAREHLNQRQIDIIKNEIIAEQQLDDAGISVGIITPYRKQTEALQKAFTEPYIQADTINKFQGREKDVIILSTVDNQISPFTDDANRLNVAISRAGQQLILVLNGDAAMHDTNIGDLVHYMRHNNFETIQSATHSVFDYLYKTYAQSRRNLLKQYNKISEYDSENLFYALIQNALKAEQFRAFDVVAHIPLRMILRNMEKLDDAEKRYAANIWTHTDFLIFNKFGNIPKLAIEVDGTAFHKEGTRQAERDRLKDGIFKKYGLPLLRFKTDGSNEQERLAFHLNRVLNSAR